MYISPSFIFLGYISVLITFLSAPLPLSSITTFQQLSNLGCNYNPINGRVNVPNPCPKNVWYNSTFYKSHGNREFKAGQDFTIMSYMPHDYNVSRLVGEMALLTKKHNVDLETLIEVYSPFVEALTDYAKDRFRFANCSRFNDQACLENFAEEIANSPEQVFIFYIFWPD